MTRKRFVKLMMASGWSRNQANRITTVIASEKKSFQEIWDIKYKNMPLVHFGCFTEAFVDALNLTCEAISRLANSFSEASSAFVKTFNETFNDNSNYT